MGVASGTFIVQQTKDDAGNVTGERAGVYLGEDANGTGIWAPFTAVEKIEPGDFDSAPADFAGAVNAGPKIEAPAAAAPPPPSQAEVEQAQQILARAQAAAGLQVQ